VIDNNADVYTILSTVGKTYPQYPEIFTTFPIISYWDSNHEADDYQDNKSGVDIIETTVDIWEKEDSSGNLIKIHVQVDSAMRTHGFIRTGPIVGLYEDDTHVYHYQGRYKKIYEEVD